jgi:spore germination cell wall hydrolase CwlJ-like protein
MIITTAAAYCLALNVYFEARGEEPDAQRMIAEVVMERVYTDGYPKTVCGVVWQKGQFSWTNDGKSDRPKDTVAWLQAQIVANEVLLYGGEFRTGATHYATRDAHPYWAKDMQIVGMYGNHIFYVEKGCDE